MVGDQAAVERDGGDDDVAERAPGAPLRAHGLQAGAERGEPLARGVRAHAGERVRVGAGGDQVAAVLLARGGDDARRGGGADAAPRRLDGAPERLRVGRVGEQREVGERVAHLGALVQAEAAEHAVRDPGRGQRGLRRPGRVAGAGEHEHLAGRRAGGQRVGDQAGHPGGLVALVREAARDHAPAGAARRDQLRVARARALWAMHAAGGGEDLGARAEVARQRDPAVLRVALAEAQDVARLGDRKR